MEKSLLRNELEKENNRKKSKTRRESEEIWIQKELRDEINKVEQKKRRKMHVVIYRLARKITPNRILHVTNFKNLGWLQHSVEV